MRWFVTFVAAVCLLGAGERPQRPRSDDTSKLEQASHAVCNSVRRAGSGCDLRLPVLALASAPSLDDPPRARCDHPDRATLVAPRSRPPSVSCRGPPHG